MQEVCFTSDRAEANQSICLVVNGIFSDRQVVSSTHTSGGLPVPPVEIWKILIRVNANLAQIDERKVTVEPVVGGPPEREIHTFTWWHVIPGRS